MVWLVEKLVSNVANAPPIPPTCPCPANTPCYKQGKCSGPGSVDMFKPKGNTPEGIYRYCDLDPNNGPGCWNGDFAADYITAADTIDNIKSTFWIREVAKCSTAALYIQSKAMCERVTRGLGMSGKVNVVAKNDQNSMPRGCFIKAGSAGNIKAAAFWNSDTTTEYKGSDMVSICGASSKYNLIFKNKACATQYLGERAKALGMPLDLADADKPAACARLTQADVECSPQFYVGKHCRCVKIGKSCAQVKAEKELSGYNIYRLQGGLSSKQCADNVQEDFYLGITDPKCTGPEVGGRKRCICKDAPQLGCTSKSLASIIHNCPKSCNMCTVVPDYTIDSGKDCGGDAMFRLDDGTLSPWTASVTQCEARCTADKDCNGFVYRDNACNFRKNVHAWTIQTDVVRADSTCYSSRARLGSIWRRTINTKLADYPYDAQCRGNKNNYSPDQIATFTLPSHALKGSLVLTADMADRNIHVVGLGLVMDGEHSIRLGTGVFVSNTNSYSVEYLQRQFSGISGEGAKWTFDDKTKQPILCGVIDVNKCAHICQAIPNCRYFSISSNKESCGGCFVHKVWGTPTPNPEYNNYQLVSRETYYTADGGLSNSCPSRSCNHPACPRGMYRSVCSRSALGGCVSCTSKPCPIGFYRSGCGMESSGFCTPCTNAKPGQTYSGPGALENNCPVNVVAADCEELRSLTDITDSGVYRIKTADGWRQVYCLYQDGRMWTSVYKISQYNGMKSTQSLNPVALRQEPGEISTGKLSDIAIKSICRKQYMIMQVGLSPAGDDPTRTKSHGRLYCSFPSGYGDDKNTIKYCRGGYLANAQYTTKLYAKNDGRFANYGFSAWGRPGMGSYGADGIIVQFAYSQDKKGSPLCNGCEALPTETSCNENGGCNTMVFCDGGNYFDDP